MRRRACVGPASQEPRAWPQDDQQHAWLARLYASVGRREDGLRKSQRDRDLLQREPSLATWVSNRVVIESLTCTRATGNRAAYPAPAADKRFRVGVRRPPPAAGGRRNVG